MRILALSDIHNSLGLLKRVAEKAPESDIALICGDLTSLGPKENCSKIMKILHPRKVLAVPGNMDSNEVLETLEAMHASIHCSEQVLFGKKFCGFGGGLSGRAGLLNFSEEEIEKCLAGLVQGESILVTHLPPFGSSLDLAQDREHIGSSAVRRIIEEKKPLLHLCGHVHEAFGEERLGSTLSVNVGAVKNGKAAFIEIGKRGKMEIERIEAE